MAIINDGAAQNQPTQDQLALDTIINNIPAMVFYKDLDGVYIAANEMFCRQLNTTPAELVGHSDFDFYDEASALRFRDTDLEVIHTGRSSDTFDDEISINGETRIFTTRKVLLRDNDGNPSGIIGLSYDTTDSHRAEQELTESRTSYKYMYNVFRLMADNIPDLLWAKDLRKHYLFANKAVCEMILGATDTEEPIGKTDLYFAEREQNSHPDDAEYHTFGDICSNTDDVTMRQKSPGRFDEYGKVKGEYIFLDVQKAPIMDEDGNMIGTVGSGRDITMQKLMEQEFQSLYQRNRAIIEALPDLMFLFDDEGTCLETYASNPDELPDSPDNLIERNVRDFFGPEIAMITIDAIRKCLLTETIQSFEYKLHTGTCPQYYEARLIRVDDKKALCISRNVTVQTILQQELVEAKETAEESARLKSTLLHNISHEIRTPLNGILGFSDIMMKELKDPDYIEMATYINKSGKRLMKTLDSIMQLSQLESGVKTLQKDNIDIELDLRKIVNSFNDIATEKGLFIEMRKIPSCHGYLDSFLLMQAISNILENALKFTQKGGVIIEASEIFRDHTRFLSIRIEDTGIGISDDHRKIIFDEFRQVSEGRNRNFEGTGLGLTIAIKMVQLLGGDIVVESEMGKGSVFLVTLPFPAAPGNLAEPTPPAGSQKQVTPATVRSNAGLPVLVVEENEVNAQLIYVYLRNNYLVHWARDGANAIDMVKNQAFAAVLIGINPNGHSGFQTIEAIRQQPGYGNIPVIALTGFTMTGDRELLSRAGFTGYLAKPVAKSELLELLEKVLQSGG